MLFPSEYFLICSNLASRFCKLYSTSFAFVLVVSCCLERFDLESAHSSMQSGRLSRPTFRNVHFSWNQTLCRRHRMHYPLAPVIWRFRFWGTSLIVKGTVAASSVVTRCHLINSNCCPHIGGIPQPAPCWTHLSSRLPLWSRTVEGGCDIPDDFYSHYFQHLVLHRPGGVRACFLDQPNGSALLSSVRRWNVWVKLELPIISITTGGCACLHF